MRAIATGLLLTVVSISGSFGADPPTTTATVRPDLSPTRDFNPQRDVMTNEGVVLLSDAGFSDAFVVEKMLLSRTRFDTSVEGLAYLLRNGISQELVQFIMERSAKPAVPIAQPEYVPMKVEKRKVLVPDTNSIAVASTAAPVVTALPRVAGPVTAYPAPWYFMNAWPAAAQPSPAWPYPALQAPAISFAPSVPIMTPASAAWLATR